MTSGEHTFAAAVGIDVVHAWRADPRRTDRRHSLCGLQQHVSADRLLLSVDTTGVHVCKLCRRRAERDAAWEGRGSARGVVESTPAAARILRAHVDDARDAVLRADHPATLEHRVEVLIEAVRREALREAAAACRAVGREHRKRGVTADYFTRAVQAAAEAVAVEVEGAIARAARKGDRDNVIELDARREARSAVA